MRGHNKGGGSAGAERAERGWEDEFFRGGEFTWPHASYVALAAAPGDERDHPSYARAWMLQIPTSVCIP